MGFFDAKPKRKNFPIAIKREAYERELSTMPLTQNEYVELSEDIQNKWNQMASEGSYRE